MAKVRLMQTGMHVPWAVGEIVTVQVASDAGDGEFLCDTIETYPADFKDQHVAELTARDLNHAGAMEAQRAQHAAEVERLQHQIDLAKHLEETT
ncbi:MAG: hypothetical protein ACHQC8_02545 [Solirubrobacterales bacterium]